MHDEELRLERMKSQAILIGAFFNPEMANRMLKQERPDFKSSDEDWEDTTKYVREQIEEQAQFEGKRKSRRRLRKGKRKVIR